MGMRKLSRKEEDYVLNAVGPLHRQPTREDLRQVLSQVGPQWKPRVEALAQGNRKVQLALTAITLRVMASNLPDVSRVDELFDDCRELGLFGHSFEAAWTGVCESASHFFALRGGRLDQRYEIDKVWEGTAHLAR